MLKIIDKLIIRSFIPPFILTFFVALFVLVMQFLWKYIDEIVGKGLELQVILELLFYRSTSLFPMALPIAVLISSVMVMGSMGEKYELSSLKSSGVSLTRVMRPMMILVLGISLSSFAIANYLIPISNLKFKSRLYDIRKQRPTLSLEEGTFNTDFKTVVIRIGEKDKNNSTIKDVLIYDHGSHKGNDNTIIAKNGEMFTDPSKRFLIMQLYDGNQYQDIQAASIDDRNKYPMIRTSFKSWEKIFDLSEFQLNQTDEGLFKNHHSMLSMRQLEAAMDSLNRKKDKRRKELSSYVKPFFYFRKILKDSVEGVINYVPLDSINIVFNSESKEKITSIESILPKENKRKIFKKAGSFTRSIYGQAASANRNIIGINKQYKQHEIEWHRKLSMAVACIIFLFIGAPMGAIVRKGGFGWPLLISIAFFVSFIMMMILGEKLSKEGILTAFVGIWLPCIVLFPIGLFLTIKAMNDSSLLGGNNPFHYVVKLFSKLRKVTSKT